MRLPPNIVLESLLLLSRDDQMKVIGNVMSLYLGNNTVLGQLIVIDGQKIGLITVGDALAEQFVAGLANGAKNIAQSLPENAEYHEVDKRPKPNKEL